MKNQKKVLDRILDNKQLIGFFSVIAAFLFWFFVVAVIKPNGTVTITGVPITVNEDSGFLSSAGLHVMEESKPKVDVHVTGPRYLIGSLKSSDLLVTPDLGPVTKEGKSGSYTLGLNVALKTSNSKISGLSVSPSKIRVQFDTLSTKILPVTVNVGGGQSMIADNYIMEDASVSPQAVTVTGSSAEVNQVAYAVTNVSLSNGAKQTVVSKESVSLYDSNHNLLSLKHITINNPSVTVTVPILKTKQDVPLTATFTNMPAGFDEKNIQYTVDPASVMIAGKDADVDGIDSISLSPIDFRSLDLNSTVQVSPVPVDGIIDVDNISTASVSVKLLNTGTKTLSTKDIQIINTPVGYTARLRTKQINSIKLFGPSADIGNISSVRATVDLSGVNLVEGQFEVPVTVTVPGKTGYWSTGKYYAIVQMWKD